MIYLSESRIPNPESQILNYDSPLSRHHETL